MKRIQKAICLMIALIILVMPMASCGVDEDSDILRITVDAGNGAKEYPVSYDLYRTIFLYLKSIIPDIIEDEEGHKSLATKAEQSAAIKEVTEDTLIDYYTLIALAEDYGVGITEADKQAYDAEYEKNIQIYVKQIEESDYDYKGTKEEYAEELYHKALSMVGTTPEYLEYSYYRSLLTKRLKSVIGGDLSDYLDQSYFHYKQVVVLFSKGDAVAEEAAREAISEAYEKLLNGEAIDSVIKSYANSDYQSEIYFDSYGNVVGSATGDTVSTIVINAIKALDVGGISDIISGDESERLGYFAIYQRLGFDEDYICSDSAIANAIYNYSYVGAGYYSPHYSRYSLIFESYKQNTSIEPIDVKAYQKITINTVKE